MSLSKNKVNEELLCNNSKIINNITFSKLSTSEKLLTLQDILINNISTIPNYRLSIEKANKLTLSNIKLLLEIIKYHKKIDNNYNTNFEYLIEVLNNSSKNDC